jgi:hypothetical protein
MVLRTRGKVVGKALVGSYEPDVRCLPEARLQEGRQGARVRALYFPGEEGGGSVKKRVVQSSAVNKPIKMWGMDTIDRCFDCGRFLGGICQETGNKIKYPISGPILSMCTLPAAVEVDNESSPAE